MLYWLVDLQQYFGPLRLFGQVTFRTACASLLALALCVLLGPWLITRLQSFQVRQYIGKHAPQSHQRKAGTPTMGGVLIIISIVIPTLLFTNLSNPYV
jgi:phospho-N-acetylmuramoyl-pentapeptide-transferase